MLVLDIDLKDGFRILTKGVLVSDDIEIAFLGVTKSKARIGISAPGNVEILRNELYLKKLKEQKQDKE